MTDEADNETNEPFSSADYWRRRYRSGGTSGSGSYGRLAVYKADIVNQVVFRHKVKHIVDFGCGDGNQLGLLSLRRYTGVDVSAEAVEICRETFAGDERKQFVTNADFDETARFDMAMSLDVLFHLVEDDVFDQYMRRLFRSAKRFVLIYSSDIDLDPPNPHVRHRRYSPWIDANEPDWQLLEHFEQPFPRSESSNPRHTSYAEFRLYTRVT